MIENRADTKFQNQIASKLEKLMEITFSLKRITYQMASLPVETVKMKSRHPNSSILTSMDSVFFELKRISTILQRQSDLIKTNSFKKSYEAKVCYDQFQGSQKNYLNRSEFGTFGPQAYDLTKHKAYESKNQKIRLTRNGSQEFQKEFLPQELSQYASDHDEYNQMKETLLIRNQKSGQKINSIEMKKVPSIEHVGLSQNRAFKTQYQKSKGREEVQSLQNKSEIGDRKSMVNLSKFYLEEYQKQSENEQFLREISKSRQQILRNIQKKKIKCFNAINNINCSLVDSSSYMESKLNKKQKIKSKTEKFFPSESSKNYQLCLNLVPSEQFVGI